MHSSNSGITISVPSELCPELVRAKENISDLSSVTFSNSTDVASDPLIMRTQYALDTEGDRVEVVIALSNSVWDKPRVEHALFQLDSFSQPESGRSIESKTIFYGCAGTESLNATYCGSSMNLAFVRLPDSCADCASKVGAEWMAHALVSHVLIDLCRSTASLRKTLAEHASGITQVRSGVPLGASGMSKTDVPELSLEVFGEYIRRVFANQLSQIPGVSIKLAKYISDCFPTPRKLFEAINSNDRGNCNDHGSWSVVVEARAQGDGIPATSAGEELLQRRKRRKRTYLNAATVKVIEQVFSKTSRSADLIDP